MMTDNKKVIDESPYALPISPDLTMKGLKANNSQSFCIDNSMINILGIQDPVSPYQGDNRTSPKRNEQDRPYQGVVSSKASLQRLKRIYKLKTWALVFPFLLSVFFMIQEKFIDFRTFGFVFIALTCFVAFIKMRSLEPRTNIVLMVLSLICMTMNLFDFLFQFGFIGSSGWRQTESYEFCFEGQSPNIDDEMHRTICKWFLGIYWLHAAIYLFCMICFSVFLFASAKLLRLTNYVANNKTYRIELEEEIDDE